MTTRMHGKVIVAGLRTEDEQIALTSPAPGLFRTTLTLGDVVRPGTLVGELEVLGQLVHVVAPEAAGAVVQLATAHKARVPVDHGGVLATLDPRATSAAGLVSAAPDAAARTGLVFRAPTSGRFYGRAAPDKAPFVAVGDELAPGATVCLLEVMKTFHRVTYGGATLPERARVRELLVADGADVTAGDPLLALEPA